MESSLHSPTLRAAQSSPWLVVALTFVAVLVDGFDTALLALVVPHLAEDWAISAATFTFPLVLTNVGVVVGYLSCGIIAARFGQRRMLSTGLLIFGLGTVATAVTLHLESVSIWAITRATTGIGLGVVMPMAIVLASGNAPAKRRQTVAVTVTMGLTTGAAIAGFFGNYLIGHIGTSGVFWLAGLAPLILAPLIMRLVPETTPDIQDDPSAKRSQVSQIFARKVRTSTIVLWTATFLVFVVSYTFKSWIPTLLKDYGLDRSTAGLGLAFLSLGGIFGGLILMFLSAKMGSAKALVVMSVIGAGAIATVAKVSMPPALLMATVCIAGAGVVAGQIGQSAIAVALYQESIRTTGVGWAAALGRIGSIVGPTIAGVLLGLSLPAQDIVLLFTAPVIVAALCFAVLSRRETTPQPAETIPETATTESR